MSIKINLKIFLFLIIFYLTRQIQIYAVIMFFAFLHEMGHLICGILLGLHPKTLKIMPMGLSIEFKILPNDYNKKKKRGNSLCLKEMLIAWAGPLTNIIIIMITHILNTKMYIPYFDEIIYANLIICIFNLIPIYPLDGGRIIYYTLYIIKGKMKSMHITNQISNILIILLTAISSIVIYYYKNIAILFILIYLWTIVIIENRKYEMKNTIYKILEKS